MSLKITHLKNKIAAFIALSFTAVIILSNAAGTVSAGRGGRTGASFDTSSCSGCHSGGSFTGAGITVQLLSGGSPVTSYIPGASYTLQVKVTRTGISTAGYYYGYQTVCVKTSDNSDVAGWGTIPGGSHSATWNARTYIEQSATIHTLTPAAINVPWTAPASGTGSVVFYAAGCLVNHDLATTGDEGVTTSLTITESPGCVPDTLSATPHNLLCYGAGDGSITYSSHGGTGAIDYYWTGPGGYATSMAGPGTLSGLAAGTYTVIITSTGGCTNTDTVTISQPPALSATVTATPVCPGSTLTFTTTVTGGTGGAGTYSYTWSGPNSFSSFSMNPSVTSFSSLDTGIYSLTIVDLASCTFSTSIDVGILPAPVFSLGPDTTICPPGGSIVLGVTLTGDTYLWSTSVTTPTITVTDTGYYSVTITDGSSGCSASDTVHVGYNCPSSVENTATGCAISLYPNPASEYLDISITGDHYLRHIIMHNEIGEIVYDKHFGYNTKMLDIGLARFATGVYSISIESDDNRVVQKLVITR